MIQLPSERELHDLRVDLKVERLKLAALVESLADLLADWDLASSLVGAYGYCYRESPFLADGIHAEGSR